MGEVAEMMLDGTLCQRCGDLLVSEDDKEPIGMPSYCESCLKDEVPEYKAERNKTRKLKKLETIQVLDALGLEYTRHNNDEHFIIKSPRAGRIDFFPSTGRVQLKDKEPVQTVWGFDYLLSYLVDEYVVRPAENGGYRVFRNATLIAKFVHEQDAQEYVDIKKPCTEVQGLIT